MIWKIIIKHFEDSQKKLPLMLNFIKKIPISKIVYVFSIGMLFQLRILYPHLTNRFVHRLMNLGTGNRSDLLAQNFAAIMMGLK